MNLLVLLQHGFQEIECSWHSPILLYRLLHSQLHTVAVLTDVEAGEMAALLAAQISQAARKGLVA